MIRRRGLSSAKNGKMKQTSKKHQNVTGENMQKSDLKSKVLKTKDLIGYNEGAVISRTIINKRSGTITAFSFDKGQGLSEHTAPFDAMVEVIDGQGEITIEGKKNIVKEGEFIIMPAGKTHALKAIKKFKMLLIMIKA